MSFRSLEAISPAASGGGNVRDISRRHYQFDVRRRTLQRDYAEPVAGLRKRVVLCDVLP
jgi:hypothetical protein